MKKPVFLLLVVFLSVFSVVSFAAVNQYTSYLRVSSVYVPADELTPCTVTVFVKDDAGNPVAAASVTISAALTGATVNQPAVTDANGMCTGTVVSRKLGGCTITASCNAVTIRENYILNPSFEFGSGVDANNWNEGSNHTRSSDKAQGSTSWSMKVFTTGPTASQTTPDISIIPYSYYRCSGWMYNSFTAGTQYYDMDDSMIQDPASDDLSLQATRGLGAWEYKEARWYSASLTTRKFRGVTDGGATGNCWFDNARIERLPTAQFTAGFLRIVSEPASITPNNPSQGIRVEAQSAAGDLDTSDNGSASVSSSSPTGSFSSSPSVWVNIGTVNFSSGVAGFHYKDSAVGNYIITVTRAGMRPNTQVISVVSPSQYDSACLISSPFTYAAATGINSITIFVTIKDTCEYPVPGISVTLSTIRGLSYTNISANPRVSDANGMCTWTISSLFTGSDTIFFDCGSGIFSNIFFDGFTRYTEGSDGAPNWFAQQGTWKATGGAYMGENSGDDGWFAVGASGGDINWKDCVINLKLKCASFGADWRDSARVGFRYQDNNNGYTLDLLQSFTLINFHKKSQGVYSGDADPMDDHIGTNHADGNWHKIRIGAAGNHFDIFFDGTQIFDTTDSNYKGVPPLYSGKLMLSAHKYTGSTGTTRTYFDEIQVSPFTVLFTGIADHLGVSTSGVSAGNAGPVSIEAQDTQNNKVGSYSGTATLSASSATGRFSFSKTAWVDTNIVTIVNGMGSVYYFDSTVGSSTVTISCASLNTGTSVIPVLATAARNDPHQTIDQIHFMYSILGGTDQNIGVTHVDALPGDGATTSANMGGISCRMLREDLPQSYNNKYMYFDVFDGYIYNNTNSKWTNIQVGVHYFDKGTGSIYLQYDGQADTYTQSPFVLQLTNTNLWKVTSFVIDNPRFANRQWCGTDFRFYCPSGNMYISKVTVHRAPGQNVGPTRDTTGETTFTTSDKLLITSNLFDWWVFDGWDPLDDWDQDNFPPRGLGYGVHPAGLHPSDPVRVDYSAGAGNYTRCKSLAKRLIRDTILTGFDMIKPNYCGQSGDAFYLAWVKAIVSALEELETEGYIVQPRRVPKVVQFIESYFSNEGELEYAGQKLDCTTERGKAVMYGKIRDFWSMIPSKWWGMVNNQPLIFIYGGFDVAASNQSTWNYIGQHFLQDFGRKPFILVSWGDGAVSNADVTIENWWWGEGQLGPITGSISILQSPGVGAHYHDLYCRPSPRGGYRDPMNGEWARVGLDTNGTTKYGMWDLLLEHMFNNPAKHKICVTSFNELAEGSGIQDSCEYGRKDIKDFAFYTRMWKRSPICYKFSDRASFNAAELKCQLSFEESPPSSVKPGQQFPVKIRVRNAGNVGWCAYTFHAAPNYSKGVVRLGCRQPVSGFEKMTWSMAPGDSDLIILNLKAPDSASIYTFKFDMHDYGQPGPWFTDIDPANNSTLDAVINVTAACSGPAAPVFTEINTSPGQVTLKWAPPAGVNPVKGYYVYYGVDPDTPAYFYDDFSTYGEQGSMFPAWQILGGTWTVKTKDVFGYNWVNVNNGILEGINSGADDSAPVGVMTGDPLASDYTLELRFKIVHTGTDPGDGIRIGFRRQDNLNCYSLDILPKDPTGNIRLVKIKNGAVSILASYSSQLYESGIYFNHTLYSQSLSYKSWAYDFWHQVKIRVIGAQITVWFDGVQAINCSDPSPVQKGNVMLSSRRHSLQTHDTHILFDTVKITPASSQWYLLKTTTDTSVTYNSVELGKDFSFRVCAFDSSGNTGAFSTIWTTAVPTKLAITTLSPIALKGSPSTPITVEVRSASERPVQSYEGTVTLFASSPTGRFSVDNSNWSNTNVVALSAGAVTFYYKDTQTGYPVLTLSTSGLQSCTQTAHVYLTLSHPASPSGFRLNISGNDIVLSWDKIRINEDGSVCQGLGKYEVWKSDISGGPYALVANLTVNDTSWVDSGAANTLSYYVVRGVDSDSQESAHSFELDTNKNAIVRRPYYETIGDTLTSVSIPAQAAAALYAKGRDTDNLRVIIEQVVSDTGKKISGGDIVYSYEFKPVTGNTNLAKTLDFAPQKAILKIHYNIINGFVEGTTIASALAAKSLSIFYWNGVEWIKVGSSVDMSEQTLSIQTEHLSKYAVVKTANSDKLELTKRIPPIITPNGDGINDIAFFFFENPKGIEAAGKIFDLSGSLVTNQLSNGPTSNSLRWDGKDDAGNVVDSGIYIYQIQAGEEFINGSIVVAR